MAEAGVNVVRMGEFAWDRMEPEAGKVDFAFFDEQIARLGAAGVSTIMCTPTATPPRWMTAEHGDWMRIDEAGKHMDHGTRQHCCTTNEQFPPSPAASRAPWPSTSPAIRTSSAGRPTTSFTATCRYASARPVPPASRSSCARNTARSTASTPPGATRSGQFPITASTRSRCPTPAAGPPCPTRPTNWISTATTRARSANSSASRWKSSARPTPAGSSCTTA